MTAAMVKPALEYSYFSPGLLTGGRVRTISTTRFRWSAGDVILRTLARSLPSTGAKPAVIDGTPARWDNRCTSVTPR